MTVTPFNRTRVLHQAFPRLDERALQTLSRAARLHVYPPGATICHEGQQSKTIFVLGEGTADIYARVGPEQQLLINRVEPGGYFGELGPLGNTPRAATVKAAGLCHTLEINSDTFLDLVFANRALFVDLMSQVGAYLRDTDRAIMRELQEKNELLQAVYADSAREEQLRSDFVTLISHELRTPLATTQALLHLIRQGMLENEALQEGWQGVSRDVETIVALINQLLALYEIHLVAPRYTRLEVAPLLQMAREEALGRRHGNLEAVALEVAPSCPPLHGDERGLTLVFRSLMESALKQATAPGPVKVKAYARDAGTLRVDVDGEGAGLDASRPLPDQVELFEPACLLPGEKGESLPPELGIGLAIAHFVVERHHGHLLVAQPPGQSRVFCVELPAAGA